MFDSNVPGLHLPVVLVVGVHKEMLLKYPMMYILLSLLSFLLKLFLYPYLIFDSLSASLIFQFLVLFLVGCFLTLFLFIHINFD